MRLKGVTPYHAKYLAASARRKFPIDSLDRLLPILYDADIEILPHQIYTAHSILNTPISKGSILADEVGLGKSIEACITMAWLWHKGQRKQLLVVPVSQMEMWKKTLSTKFNLPCVIIYREELLKKKKRKRKKPFRRRSIVICSFKTALMREKDIQEIEWDLVVIDEAHRLKNIYDLKSEVGDSIRRSVLPHKKILITSTPFQSTLKRLFRLANLVDRYTFGDQRSFNYQFVSITDDIDYKDLSSRLHNLMRRTTSKRVGDDVLGSTSKNEILVSYIGTKVEQDYITALTNYFIDGSKFGFPSGDASIQGYGLFKKMVVSPKIAMGGIGIVDEGLRMLKEGEDAAQFLTDRLKEDIESLVWVEDEWYRAGKIPGIDVQDLSKIQKHIDDEREQLLILREYMLQVKDDSRIKALYAGLSRAEGLAYYVKGKKRYIIFTESLEAQKYIKFMMDEAGYRGVYKINYTNEDDESEKIYQNFLKRKKNQFIITGDEGYDRRQAIVKEFESRGKYLIATDMGLVDQKVKHTVAIVNYDLPFDPYLSQQRMLKAHGYHNPQDLLIVNIVNEMNELELWNYQKQEDLFNMFSGLFGREDTAVGAVGPGTDFAMLVFGLYMKHQTINQLDEGFRKMKIQITEAASSSMNNYYNKLLIKTPKKERDEWESLMKEYTKKMKNVMDAVKVSAAAIIGRHGTVSARGAGSMNLQSKPFRMRKEDLGEYGFDFDRRPTRRKFYINSSLGGKIIDRAVRDHLPVKKVRFRYRSVSPRLKSLKDLKGKSGSMNLKIVTVKGMQDEEHLVFTALSDEGDILTQEQCHDLMSLRGKVMGPAKVSGQLRSLFKENRDYLLDELTERDSGYLRDFSEKLDVWVRDRVLVHKRDLRMIMIQKRKLHRRWINARRERKRQKLENELLEVGVFRRKKRRYIRKVTKISQEEKEELISRFGEQTNYKTRSKNLFTIKWELK